MSTLMTPHPRVKSLSGLFILTSLDYLLGFGNYTEQ